MNVPKGFELIDCPSCHSREFSLAQKGRDWDSPASPEFHVVRCNACGLAYLNPRPTVEHLRTYYPDHYAPYQKQKGEIERKSKIVTTARLFVMRNAYARPDLRPQGAMKMLAHLFSLFKSAKSAGEATAYFGNGRFLDFGCGSGTFLRRMRAMGWTGVGIDFGDAPVQRVRESGIEAHVGTLPSPDLQPASFDLITMRHSLEHVGDPRSVLVAARDLLVPGGVLEIRVPNFAGWEIEHFGSAANMLDLPRHLIHFEEPSLRKMLTDCGYVNIEVEHRCRPGSLKKSAKRLNRATATKLDRRLAKSTMYCRWIARKCEQRRAGNELIMTARKA